MSEDIFRYCVILGTSTYFFGDFKSAEYFARIYGERDFTRIYKLVYVNGELVKDGKK